MKSDPHLHLHALEYVFLSLSLSLSCYVVCFYCFKVGGRAIVSVILLLLFFFSRFDACLYQLFQLQYVIGACKLTHSFLNFNEKCRLQIEDEFVWHADIIIALYKNCLYVTYVRSSIPCLLNWMQYDYFLENRTFITWTYECFFFSCRIGKLHNKFSHNNWNANENDWLNKKNET